MKIVNVIYNPLLKSYRVVEADPKVSNIFEKQEVPGCGDYDQVVNYFRRMGKRKIGVNLDADLPREKSSMLEGEILRINPKAFIAPKTFKSQVFGSHRDRQV